MCFNVWPAIRHGQTKSDATEHGQCNRPQVDMVDYVTRAFAWMSLAARHLSCRDPKMTASGGSAVRVCKAPSVVMKCSEAAVLCTSPCLLPLGRGSLSDPGRQINQYEKSGQ